MTKEERISKELGRLKRIFRDLPKDKRNLCDKLMQNAAYMSVTLEDLQETVNEEGATLASKNGNGFITIQEHPANKAYTNMIAKYSSVINQLNAFLPDQKTEAVAKAGESLAAFVAKGK